MTAPAEQPAAEDLAVQRFTALRLQLIQTAEAAIAAADVLDQLIVERQDELAEREAGRG